MIRVRIYRSDYSVLLFNQHTIFPHDYIILHSLQISLSLAIQSHKAFPYSRQSSIGDDLISYHGLLLSHSRKSMRLPLYIVPSQLKNKLKLVPIIWVYPFYIVLYIVIADNTNCHWVTCVQ